MPLTRKRARELIPETQAAETTTLETLLGEMRRMREEQAELRQKQQRRDAEFSEQLRQRDGEFLRYRNAQLSLFNNRRRSRTRDRVRFGNNG